MVLESLRVLLFGMAGIFVVMGVIFLALFILNNIGKKGQKDKPVERP